MNFELIFTALYSDIDIVLIHNSGVEHPMKRSLVALIPVLALAITIVGCGNKKGSGPVTIKKFDTYDDPVLKFSVRYPTDWPKGIQPGSQAVFYSSEAITDGFTRYDARQQTGAKIDVRAMLGGQEAMDSSIAELKRPFTEQSVFQAPQQTTLNGMPATKLSYGFDVDETKFTAERYYIIKDGVVTYFETAVIGTYADYAAVFDTARASFKPGMVASRAATNDSSGAAVKDSDLVEPPAATMKPYSNAYFSIQYPSNFSPGSAHAGGAASSTNFSGARNDSYFQVDVIEPKDDATLSAIVEGNKKNYGGRAAAAASVGGMKGYVFSYNGGRDVSSRAYFAGAGKRIYRITVNWYTPQKDLYLPAFEKAIATFQAK